MNEWQNAVTDLQEVCRDTFGIPVSYIPSVNNRPELQGEAISLVAVFDKNREMVNIMSGAGGGMDSMIPRPVLSLRRDDLGIDPMEEDEVVISGITYRVIDVNNDEFGASVLVLHRGRDSY
jgi:hypothetical protein